MLQMMMSILVFGMWDGDNDNDLDLLGDDDEDDDWDKEDGEDDVDKENDADKAGARQKRSYGYGRYRGGYKGRHRSSMVAMVDTIAMVTMVMVDTVEDMVMVDIGIVVDTMEVIMASMEAMAMATTSTEHAEMSSVANPVVLCKYNVHAYNNYN